MTILEAIKGITNYPIPQGTIDSFSVRRAVDTTTTVTQNVLLSKSYRLLEADVKRWLVSAPNITEGGITFSFSPAERDEFKREAIATYIEYDEQSKTVQFGYKGENL